MWSTTRVPQSYVMLRQARRANLSRRAQLMDMIRKNIGMPPDGKKYGCVFIYPTHEDAYSPVAKAPETSPRGRRVTDNRVSWTEEAMLGVTSLQALSFAGGFVYFDGEWCGFGPDTQIVGASRMVITEDSDGEIDDHSYSLRLSRIEVVAGG